MLGINMIPLCVQQTLAGFMEPLLHVDKICFLYICQPSSGWLSSNSPRIGKITTIDPALGIISPHFQWGIWPPFPSDIRADFFIQTITRLLGMQGLKLGFVYANQAYGELIGLKCAEDCIWRTDFEMPSQRRPVLPNFNTKIAM